jgi:hypothetical protein
VLVAEYRNSGTSKLQVKWKGPRRVANVESDYVFVVENDSMLEELGAELEELRTMRQWEEPNADETQERNLDAESVEDAVEQKLAPFTELRTQLTRKVEQSLLRDGGMDDNNGPRKVFEAGPSATGRYARFWKGK